MTQVNARAHASLGGVRAWSIVALLFLCQALNYGDKVVLSITAPKLISLLGLSNQQYGMIASSFFTLYSLAGVLVGMFAIGRVSPKWLLAGLVGAWSLAQLPIVLMPGFATLLTSRLVLGIAEGPANPVAMSIGHSWFANAQRDLPSATIMVGGTVGALVSAPLLSWVVVTMGWKAAFLACSAASAVWLLGWCVLGEDGPVMAVPGSPDVQAERPIAITAIWTDRTILGHVTAGFCAYWTLTFILTWLPPILVTGLNLPTMETGWIVAAVQALTALLVLAASLGSQHAIRRGASSRHARGYTVAAALLLAGVALVVAAFVRDRTALLFLLGLGGALPAIAFALGPVMVSEVTPTARRSQTLVIASSVLTAAGFGAPVVTGHLLNAGIASGLSSALAFTGLIALVGGVLAAALFDPERSLARFESLASSVSRD